MTKFYVGQGCTDKRTRRRGLIVGATGDGRPLVVYGDPLTIAAHRARLTGAEPSSIAAAVLLRQ